jgi:hypothetical protein
MDVSNGILYTIYDTEFSTIITFQKIINFVTQIKHFQLCDHSCKL